MAVSKAPLEVNKHFLSSVDNQPDSFGINLQKPKFPQYAVVSKRADSFKTWPAYLPLKPDVLIEAGLVYTGVGDSVRCYHCGGGLRNWEADDNPWEEHAKWYPSCPHVLLVKGQRYVDMLTRGEKPEQDGPRAEVQQSPEIKEDLMKSVAAQSCIQNGFSENLVKRAIDIIVHKRNGKTDFNGADLCEVLFELEESDADVTTLSAVSSELSLSTVSSDLSPSSVSSVLTSASNVTDSQTSIKESEKQDSEQVASNLSENNSEDLHDLLSENQRLKENQMCKICLDDVANVIFLPCGHMVSCPQCAPALNKCPICRNAVKGYVKAYFGTVDEKS